jgi:hypothetical protein
MLAEAHMAFNASMVAGKLDIVSGDYATWCIGHVAQN